MKVTPLVLHAAMRIPAVTDLFSTVLPAASMAVAEGAFVTITAAHGLATGQSAGIAVVAALAPNAVASASLESNGDVRIGLTYQHDFTTTPDASLFDPHDSFVTMTGWSDPALDGDIHLVAVPDPFSVVVRPQGSVDPLPAFATAKVLQRLEPGLTGWHRATAMSPTVLQFATPAHVARSYTVEAPKIALNVRCWGVLDLETLRKIYVRRDDAAPAPVSESYLFIMPASEVRISRDRRVRSDAFAEASPHTDNRYLLIDGFKVLAVLPAERYGGAVGCVDRAHGEIFAALLKTFHGLKLPRSELCEEAGFVAQLTSHASVYYDGANYIHGYTFEAPAYIGNWDAIGPSDWASLAGAEAALQSGLPAAADDIVPVGDVPLDGIVFDPLTSPVSGIFVQGHASPLAAHLTLRNA